MLGSDFRLKIIDFDQAQLISDGIMTSGGTPVYRAPEVFDESQKDLSAIDIYSMGIILYAFGTGKYPFVEVQNERGQIVISDSLFFKDNATFWKMKTWEFGEKILNKDFIELINGMLREDPVKRFKLRDIKESKWYKEAILSHQSLCIRMKALLANIRIKRSLYKNSFVSEQKKQ